MSLEPSDWAVVVLGGWNPAILTPSGVREHVFGLEDATPLEVEVPLNQVGPYRVKHDGLIVLADRHRLTVSVADPSPEMLSRAKECAIRAVERLPRTPLSAAGINIGYVDEEPGSSLLRLFKTPLHRLLSQSEPGPAGWGERISIPYHPGVANINLSYDQQGNVQLVLNFHLSSGSKDEICEWLSKPTGEYNSFADKIVNVIQTSQAHEDSR